MSPPNYRADDATDGCWWKLVSPAISLFIYMKKKRNESHKNFTHLWTPIGPPIVEVATKLRCIKDIDVADRLELYKILEDKKGFHSIVISSSKLRSSVLKFVYSYSTLCVSDVNDGPLYTPVNKNRTGRRPVNESTFKPADSVVGNKFGWTEKPRK